MTCLAIGPANYAGQAHEWCRATGQQLLLDAISFSFAQRPGPPKGFGFPVDRMLRYPRLSHHRQRHRAAYRLLRGCTHLALDGFVPVIGSPRMGLTMSEVETLQTWVPHLALIAHGSDVRDPDLHMERLGYSYYASAPDNWTELARATSRRNRELAAATGLPVYVSTPDLLLDVPEATWLPVTVRPRMFGGTRPPRLDRPVVLHLPSRRQPPIKGTDVIGPVLDRLERFGRIYHLSPDQARHRDVPKLLGCADIVVDQIRSGSYGVGAVEALAAGRVVVGNIAEDVRHLMPEAPPIIDATPIKFEERMDEILRDAEGSIRAATLGPQFVERWHSGTAAARVIGHFLRGTGVDAL